MAMTRNYVLNSCKFVSPYTLCRKISDSCETGIKKGLLLAAYDGCATGELKLTHTGNKFDEEVGGKVKELIKGSGIRLGHARVLHNLSPEYYAVAVSGVGPEGLGYNEGEVLNECKENIRVAAAVGARALQDMGVGYIMVEGFHNCEAAAEGSALAVWRFQDYKSKSKWKTVSKVDLYEDPDKEGWDRGIYKAEAQNIVRKLADIPANIMTPATFAQAAIEILCPCGVQVEVRDREWMETKKMNAFLSMAKGSCEPPLFLEMSYCGGGPDDKPVVLVGKGLTFDSGGICLYKCKGMSEMRADMAGAAVLVGTLKGMATMNIPINVNAVAPLCENMPGGQSIKPGDVVIGLAERSMRVADSSKEGRIILADAIAYTANYKPCIVINVATCTVGIRTAMGSSSTGVFSTSDVVWAELKKAGAETGDRVWRFPFWNIFSKRVKHYHAADLTNVHLGRGGDPCACAAFLLEFAPPVDFVHMDITGTGMLSSGFGMPYLRAGNMSGRPTRTLVQFLYQMACPQDKSAPC